MNIPDILRMAKLSKIAYERDESKSHALTEDLGLCWRGIVGNEGCQALIVEDDSGSIVAFRGTEGVHLSDIRELQDDADIIPKRTAFGLVACGPWGDMADLTDPIGGMLRGRIRVTGHSLGGGRAHLSRAIWPEISEAVSFGAPPVADRDFWRSIWGNSAPIRIVHGRDPIPDAGLAIGWSHPGEMLWVINGAAQSVAYRHGLDVDMSDHDISSYIYAIGVLK